MTILYLTIVSLSSAFLITHLAALILGNTQSAIPFIRRHATHVIACNSGA